jgi:hypothetical protein
MARTPNDDTPHPVAVKKGSLHDRKQQDALAKFTKAQKADFKTYKKKLREMKKNVPPEERAKINWSQVPKRFLHE